MSTIDNYFKYATLATAAYVRIGGTEVNGPDFAIEANAQNNGRLPSELGRFLFDPENAYGNPVWDILYYYGGDVPATQDPIAAQDRTGFGATLFERGGEKVLAIRGTEPSADGFVDLGSAGIGQIGLLGLALTQVVSMVNLIQRMRTEPGSAAVQVRISASLIPPAGDYLTVAGTPPMFLSFSTYTAAGVGGIAPGERIKVTGHSLGGHLAYMAARLFPGVVDPEIHIYNAAGYDPTTANFLGNSVGVGFALATVAKNYLTTEFGIAAAGVSPSANQLTEPALDLIAKALRGSDATQGVPIIINLRNEDIAPGDDLSIVASRITGADRYPVPTDIPIEANSHVIEPMMDALALHSLLESLGGKLSLEDMGQLLMDSSSELTKSEERLTEALRTLFLGERGELPVSDATNLGAMSKGDIAARAAFHDSVLQIQDAIKDQRYSLDPLHDTEPAELARLAQGSDAYAYRYALKELNPFAVVGDNGLYAPHNRNGELDVYDPVTRAGSLTPVWLGDRAEMLNWKNLYYENDGNVALRGNRVETYEFTDRAIKDDRTGEDLTITVVGRDSRLIGNPARVIFGSDADETLVGSNVAAGDRLYGGGGVDVLQGNQGNDYLEGGRGNDTYVWNTGDGFDTIRDADGSGLFVINGLAISAGFQIAEGLYISNDEAFVLGFEGDLAAGGTLTINADLRVEGFRNGDLGISLENASNVALIQPTINALEGSEGIGGASDGNDLFIPSPIGTHFFARGGDDLSQPASDLPSTTLVGDSGDDILFGGTGIVDSLWGGAGRDVLHGGDSRDLLVGDYDRAEFYRTGEFGAPDLDFDIYYRLDGGARYSFRYTGTRDPGDFYDISIGGYYLSDPLGSLVEFAGGWEEALRHVLGIGADADTSTLYDDVLHGGLGDDLAFGGPGSDNIMGGDGDDTLHGDYGGSDPVTIAVSGVAPEQATSIRALLGDPGDDYVDGGNGNDVISDVDGGHDILVGGEGADRIVSEDPADSTIAFHNFLDGGDGNDSLLSVNRSAGGHDTLFGGDGDDVVEVRVGSAYVEGGSGSDTYIVRDGFSPLVPDFLPRSLVINDFDETGDGIDRLQIALWNPWSALSITRDETNLYFGLGGNPNWITVENWFSGSSYRIEEVVFDDRTTPGIDQVYDAASLESQFTTATDAADLLWGRAADERLVGGFGDDRMLGGAGDDILAGNEGSDILDGGEGSDQYAFNIGDGVDRILDSGNFGSDLVVFGPGITPEMLTLSIGSMLITIGESGDAIHLDGFDPANARASGNIEYFEFADGTMLHYQELLDRGFDIAGTDSDDVLVGTSVNDRFTGGLGNDTYIFGRGSGQDVISDQDSVGVDTNVIRIGPDIAPSDVAVNRERNFITLAINETSDQVSIQWQPEAGYGIERIEFADGTTWSATFLEERSAGNGTTPPPTPDPPESPPDDAEDPSIPPEIDCPNLISRGGHVRRGQAYRKRRRELDPHGDLGDDSKRVRDRVAECLVAHLAHRPRFEFETLLEELEIPGRDGSDRNSRELERSWRAVARFGAAYLNERDDNNNRRGAAIHSVGGIGVLAGGDFAGIFGRWQPAEGLHQRAANLQAFRGLEDGFQHLNR
jgi:Ca2+-binding RTX toxin-like protein